MYYEEKSLELYEYVSNMVLDHQTMILYPVRALYCTSCCLNPDSNRITTEKNFELFKYQMRRPSIHATPDTRMEHMSVYRNPESPSTVNRGRAVIAVVAPQTRQKHGFPDVDFHSGTSAVPSPDIHDLEAAMVQNRGEEEAGLFAQGEHFGSDEYHIDQVSGLGHCQILVRGAHGINIVRIDELARNGDHNLARKCEALHLPSEVECDGLKREPNSHITL